MRISGQHAAYKREDGSMVEEQRRLTASQHLDRLIPYLITGLLGWLCYTTNGLQGTMATLVERTGNQSRTIDSEREDRLAADKFLQSELEALRDNPSVVRK